MIVLGIDPGVATIGFGVIRAERQKNTLIQYGVITTPPGIPLSSRLLQISDDMEELIRTFHPDEMAVEELFFNTNITTGIAVEMNYASPGSLQRNALYSIGLVLFLFIMLINAALNLFLKRSKEDKA